MVTAVSSVITEHIAAVNAFSTDAIVATFSTDAYVNDNRREMFGIDAVRRWVAKQLVGDRVTMTVREILEHHGETIVRAVYDGNYDKTNLPKELILTNYFRVEAGKIVGLIIVFNQPSPS